LEGLKEGRMDKRIKEGIWKKVMVIRS
jgi:hypothetical protein